MKNEIGQFLLVIVIAAASMFLASSIFSADRNSIGQAAAYGMGAAFVFGMLSPRGGIWLLIILAAYSDLLKRFMVLGSNISTLDLVYVLGMAPAAVAGVALSCFLKKSLGGGFRRSDLFLLSISAVFMVVGLVAAIKGGAGLRGLRFAADYGAFSLLVFVLPNLYPTREKLLGLIKKSLLIFVPVAAYGIWQRVNGLADFEVAYLMTGLSVESRQLADVAVRPFSTLNAATSLTMVMAASSILVLRLRKERMMSLVAAYLLLILFLAACYMTFTRVGWLTLVVGVGLIPILRYKTTTILMYVGGFCAFVWVVMASGWILENLNDWQDVLYGSSDSGVGEEQGLRIMTLSDRFIGFENMKIRSNWQPFGIEEEGQAISGLGDRYSTTFSHDAFSRFLFNHGYVPLGLTLILGGAALFWIHKSLFRLPLRPRRSGQFALAGAFGMLSSLATGGTIFQFPSNVFFWFLISLVIVEILGYGKSGKKFVDDSRVESQVDSQLVKQ